MSNSSRDGEHLLPTSRLWPDEEHGPWLLTFHWQVIAGRAECVGFEIASSMAPEELRHRFDDLATLPEVGQPVTTGVLRSLSFADLVADERYRAEHLIARVTGGADEGKRYTEPPKMRAATLQRLERAAAAYRDAWTRGEPPTKAVAHRLGVTEGAAANLVMRARSAGLLPPTSPGSPQG